MKENLIKLKNKLLDFFNVGQVVSQSVAGEKDLFEQVKEAHLEWQIALNNYNYCADPDFIDYSIYNIDAKEKKFVYLVKMARKEKIVLDFNINDGEFIKGFDNN
jgi:hypothetical protein